MSEPRYYGVSSGDGNNGVSHTFPDYICKTDDPWRFAELAAVTSFETSYQGWAKDNVQIDGEEDYTISACFHNMPDDEDDTERDYCPLIIEVFPWEGDLPEKPVYESLDDCFVDDVKLVA